MSTGNISQRNLNKIYGLKIELSKFDQILTVIKMAVTFETLRFKLGLFFFRLTGEEKGFSLEKWRKLEKNGESLKEF